MQAKLFQSCLTLCDPMDHNPPGSSVHGTLQARIRDWVDMPSSRDRPDAGMEPVFLVSWIGRLFFFFLTTSATWETLYMISFVFLIWISYIVSYATFKS